MKRFSDQFLTEFRPPSLIHYDQSWSWKPAHPKALRNFEKWIPKKPLIISKARSKKKQTVLLIGPSRPSMGWLLEELQSRGEHVIFLDFDEWIFRGEFSLNERALKLGFDHESICVEGVRSIYLEVPDAVEGPVIELANPTGEELLALKRWKAVWRSLPSVFPNARFFPGPPTEIVERAQNKLQDLKLAGDLGWKTPRTLTSNNKNTVLDFCADVGGEVLVRDFNQRRIWRGKKIFTFSTEPVKLTAKMLSGLEAAPLTFQEYVPKKFELRAVVVDDRVLVCRIDSQASVKTKVDWRNYDFPKVAMTPWTMSTADQRKIVRMSKELGLRIASFDFIVDPDDRLVFLEMNRPGSWMFLELLAGLPLRQSIADALTK